MADQIGGVDSKALATEAMAAAVNSQLAPEDAQGEMLDIPPINPQQHAQPEADVPTATEIMEGVEVEVEGTLMGEEEPPVVDPVPVVPVVEEPVVAAPQGTLDEVAMALQQAGIDLGVNRADLPAELHQAYDNLTNTALVAASDYQNRVNQLQNSQAEMQQFATQLQEDPAKVLLTLAVTNPEAFRASITQFEEMESDERFASMVKRELQAEATLKAAQRAQMVNQQTQQQTYAGVLTNATRTAAAQYGVDPKAAEEMVAMAIQAGGGQLEASAIPGIVSRLRPVAPVPVVATPAKVAAVAAAPTAPVQGTGEPAAATPTVRDEASYGLTTKSQHPLMDLVKDASRRASIAMRGE